MEIKSGKTAIKRSKLSKPLSTLINKDIINFDQLILDYGHGKGDDMKSLRESGWRVEGWDPNHWLSTVSYIRHEEIPLNCFDAVYCGYVLNVLEFEGSRLRVVGNVHSFLVDGGVAAFSSRSTKDIDTSRRDSWIRYMDGWVTTKQTFQAGLSPAYIVNLLDAAGFSTMEVISKEPVIVIGRK